MTEYGRLLSLELGSFNSFLPQEVVLERLAQPFLCAGGVVRAAREEPEVDLAPKHSDETTRQQRLGSYEPTRDEYKMTQ